MSTEELSRTLSKLHEELADSPELDENTRRSLRAVLGEIQVAIDRAGGGEAIEEETPVLSVSGRLQEVIDEFEARHPRLTLTLSQIADRLSDMGI